MTFFTLYSRMLFFFVKRISNNILKQFKRKLCYCCSVCSTILPTLKNGEIIFGDDLNEYYDGHVITYMCDPNFFSTDALYTCFCDATTDPNNPVWVCSANFTTSCKRNEEGKIKFAESYMKNRTRCSSLPKAFTLLQNLLFG